MTSIGQSEAVPLAGAAAAHPRSATAAATRLLAIDALRGLVMVFMLVDHVREAFFAHTPVSDPMDALSTEPALFFTRVTSQFCAPIFVFLTGMSAYLYGQSHTKGETAAFLLKRGLFLVILEFTVVGAAWFSQSIPPTFWAQVIWAIGLSMICLAGLIYLPRVWQVVVGGLIVAGHNLLDPISFAPGSLAHVLWGVLHDRSVFELPFGIVFKTSYPILPWIGLILLGYAIGPWFGRSSDAGQRLKRLMLTGSALTLGFLLIRYLDVYGDKPWAPTGDAIQTTMSFLSLTKYPPSLLFLMPTIGVGLLLLAWFERLQDGTTIKRLGVLGGAPMFFYILHLYVIKVLYWSAYAIWGPTHGPYFGVDQVAMLWLISALLLVPLYVPSAWFARLKQRRRDLAWLRYL